MDGDGTDDAWMSAGDLLDAEFRSPSHALPLRGEVGVITGPSGIGKSWLALQIALSVAAGRNAWSVGLGDVEQGRVLVLVPNNEVLPLRHRLGVLASGLRPEERDRMRSEVLIASGEPWSPSSVAAIAAMVAMAEARLVLLDRPDRWIQDWRGDRKLPAPLLVERLADWEDVAFLVVPTLADRADNRPRALWRADLSVADENTPASRSRLVLSVAPSMRPYFRRDIRREADGALVGYDRLGPRAGTIVLGR